MKKYLPLLFVLILACSDDDKKLSDKPPFDTCLIAVAFSHKPGTSSYEGISAFSGSAYLNDSDLYSEYYYFDKLNADGSMSGATLKVVTQESGILALEISGMLARFGTEIPASYTGDPALWNSYGCKYKLLLECDPNTEEIIAGSYEMWNEKFKFKQDIKSRMRISNYQPYEDLWSITSDDQLFSPDASFNITVSLVQ